MTINYGKRKPGGLTASDPGDTLYIPFATYNDSGASIAMSGFAVTDIEVYKNGVATARATDSGYSVISDTGQYGDNIGLNRFSVQIFNTADDTGFYESGAQYHVSVDSITVDGRTVKFFPAIFELGYPEVDVKRIYGDTGAAAHLQQFSDEYDTGRISAEATATLDTGAVSNSVWNSARADHTTAGSFGQYVIADADLVDGDTGAADRLQKFAGEQLAADGTMDTGTGLNNVSATVDTGVVANAVWNSLRADHIVAGSFGASDTGIDERLSTLETGVNVTSFSDTGINNRLAVILADTDTGIQSNVNVGSISDTGVNNVLGKILSDTDTGIQSSVNVTSIADTGINNRLDVILSDTDTGIQSSVNVTFFADTGVNERLTALETGVNVSSFADTGINNVLAKILADTDTGIQTSVVVTGFSDTGINDRLAKILADTDTGIQSSVNVTSFADTGVNLRLAQILADTDTGIQSSVNVTGFSDTGVNERLTALETGVNVTSIADTGLNNRLDVILSDTDTGIQSGVTVVGLSDTGVNARLAAISAKTDSLTFTVAGEVDANIQSVNDVAVTGTGASGNEWGP